MGVPGRFRKIAAGVRGAVRASVAVVGGAGSSTAKLIAAAALREH
jgi:hypothetical protein